MMSRKDARYAQSRMREGLDSHHASGVYMMRIVAVSFFRAIAVATGVRDMCCLDALQLVVRRQGNKRIL